MFRHAQPLRSAAIPFGRTACLATILAALPLAVQAQSPPVQPGVISLPAVDVQAAASHPGEPGTAAGPIPGYVARRSEAGTKTDTPLIETPQSVSVLSNEQLQAQKVQAVSDALRYAPGVQADSNGFDPRADNFRIRGFDQTETGLFQDGLRLYTFNNQGGVAVEPYGLERIDILRGPGSILYGQTGPGGIVDLISKRPQPVAYNEFKVQAGSYGKVQGTFDVGGPATKDGTILYRITGLDRSSGTQTEFTKDNRSFLAPAITWQPDGRTTITILTSVQYDRLGSTYDVLPRIGTLDPNPNGTLPIRRSANDSSDFYNRTRASIGSMVEHRFDDNWTVRQNLRFLELDTHYQETGYGGLGTDNRTVSRVVLGGSESVGTFTADNQVQYRNTFGRIGEMVLAGLDAQVLRSRATDLFSGANALNIYGPRTPIGPIAYTITTLPRSSLDQLGVYLQSQSKIYDHLVLTLSGRNDWAYTSTVERLNNTTQAQYDTKFTGRAGLTFLTDVGIAPYVSYAESFLPVTGLAASGAPFRPTTGRQYEVGIKYQPAGHDSYVTIAGFDLTQQNVTTPDPNNIGFSVQTGAVRARGAELEVKMAVTRSLNLVGSYTHVDTTVTKANDGTVGKAFMGTPSDLASAFADYEFKDGTLQGLGFNGGVRYIGSNFGDAANTIRVPGYALFDASIRYRLGAFSEKLDRWAVAVNATNLEDKRYVSQCGFFGNGCKYGYGRTVLGSLKYSW